VLRALSPPIAHSSELTTASLSLTLPKFKSRFIIGCPFAAGWRAEMWGCCPTFFVIMACDAT